MTQVQYSSWRLAAPLSIVLAALGILTGFIEFFVAALIPVMMVLVGYLGRTPDPDQVQLERDIEDTAPSPGQEVTVTLTVHNTGSTTYTDLRVIDAVPDDLKVANGSPRASVAVPPGSDRTITYTVVARRGSHVFGGVSLEDRGGGRDAVITETVATGDDQIACTTELEELLLRDATEQQVGDIVTDSGGSGIEFHSLRDYRSTDPPSRVEWKHLAKTGELATTNFREERVGDIVLVVDARPVADRKAEEGHPTGVALSSYAAKRAYTNIVKSRHRVGLVVLGVDPAELDVTSDSTQLPYIRPGTSTTTRHTIEEMLREVQKVDSTGVDAELRSTLYRILPPDSQVLLFTPLLDDGLPDAVTVLDRHGHPSTVVSPDITYGDTPGARLEGVRRDLRMTALRGVAPVIDWDITRPMAIQVSEALRRIYARDIR